MYIDDKYRDMIIYALKAMRHEDHHAAEWGNLQATANVRHIDAAIAALSEGGGAVDIPDSPGWWAFEGTIEIDADRIMQFVCEVVVGKDGEPLYVRTVWNIYPISFFTGKWWHVCLPWERQHPITSEKGEEA